MKLPQSVLLLLRIFFKESVREEIIGDLEEEMYQRRQWTSAFQTRLYLIKTTLLFLRYRYAWKQLPTLTMPGMFFKTTSLKTALRNLKKDKPSLILNGLGLTVAFVLSMIIYLILMSELTYDRWHSKADRIYRVTHDETISAKSTRHLSTVGPPVGPALKDFDQVENFVRFRHGHTETVRHQNSRFYEDRIFYIDSTLFSVFDFSLLHGDSKTALKDPNSVILTGETARKYFGQENPVGKILEIGDQTFNVTGVFNKIPDNTHLKFDLVIPFHAFTVPFGYPVTLNSWGWISFHTYVLLKEGVEPSSLEQPLVDFIKSNWEESRWNAFRFRLQPLTSIYLGDVESDVVESGNWNNIYGFGLAAILLLALIIFNYTNLSVARSLTRTKEVGVRKTMGATKSMIGGQFVLESVLLSVGAFVISCILLAPSVDLLEHFMSTDLGLPEWNTWINTLWPAPLFAIIVGIIAGSYPALVMSRMKALTAFTHRTSGSVSGFNVRKMLVTFQFIITVALLSGSFVIYQQINYLREKDLGFDKESLAVLRVPGQALLQEYDLLKSQLLTVPGVTHVAVGGGRMDGDNGNVPVKTVDMTESLPMFIEAAGYGFFNTLGIELVAGREFSKAYASDSAEAVIVNEKAIDVMGYASPEAALGRDIQVSDIRRGKIIGVVEDYHFSSLHHEIGPLAIVYPRTYLEDVYVRITPGSMLSLVNGIEARWQEQFPELPFDLIFLESHLNQLYTNDMMFAKLFRLFTLITIIIACTGLYALIALISTQKTKEISIRKILGASLSGLIVHLFRPFAFYVWVSVVVATPVTYYLLSRWLDNYAYQIDLNWLWFPFAGLVVLATALLATLSHSVKIAGINPARTLRSE